MKVFNRLARQIEEHKFLRGEYKGDAPLFTGQRRSDRGVIRWYGPDEIRILYQHSSIVTILRDGERESIRLALTSTHNADCRRSINHFLHSFLHLPASVTDMKIMGISQVVLRMNCKLYKFFNGITFNSNGKLLCSPEPFTAWRIDREASARFKRRIKESGFDAMFPLLFASVDNPERPSKAPAPSLYWALPDPAFADWWPFLIAVGKANARRNGEHKWDRTTGSWVYVEAAPATDKQVYAYMIKNAKSAMYHKIETDIFELPA